MASSFRAGLSTVNLPRLSRRGDRKTSSSMLKVRWFGLAVAGLSLVSTARAVTFTEDFSTDPLQNGWQAFGDTNLFQWDSTNHVMAVTWDSTQPNSYFCLPLTNEFSRGDDFGMEFDLLLDDIASGAEPGKTGPMQLGIGFLNQAEATSTNFMRGGYGDAPDVAEFDYYTSGYYDFGGGMIYPSAPATFPSFISGVNSYDYDPGIVSVFDNELPTNQVVHVSFFYSGETQSATLIVSTNGVPTAELPTLLLNAANGFDESDNIHVDMFSISSYSSIGDDYDSVLAHGTVANVVVKTVFKPVGGLRGGFTSEGIWEAGFYSHTNWNYTLERTIDLQIWGAASDKLPGLDGRMIMQDTNPPAGRAFYRVRAEQD